MSHKICEQEVRSQETHNLHWGKTSPQKNAKAKNKKKIQKKLKPPPTTIPPKKGTLGLAEQKIPGAQLRHDYPAKHNTGANYPQVHKVTTTLG